MNATILALLSVHFEHWQSGTVSDWYLKDWVHKWAIQLGIDGHQAIQDLKRWQRAWHTKTWYKPAVT